MPLSSLYRISLFLAFTLPAISYGQSEPKRYIYNDVNYDRSAKREFLPEFLISYFAPEDVKKLQELFASLGLPPDWATDEVEFKRGVIHQLTGGAGQEDQTGLFPVPKDGYTFCRAEIVNHHADFQSPKSETTTILRVLHTRAQDGLTYNIVVPKSWEGTRVTLQMRLVFVLADPNPNNPNNVVNLIKRGTCQR